MIALFSRWKLKDGCPPALASALEELTAAVKNQEPGTLLYSASLPASHPPIGPPPDYRVSDDPEAALTAEASAVLFFEIYRDAEAFSEHLRGAFNAFLDQYRDYFDTPWQGHPRPETTYLDPRTLFVRSALAGAAEPRG
jgi:quinol monooxygenase YgiN